MGDEHAEVDAVEAFDGIIEDGVVEVVDGGRKLVMGDGEDQTIRHPCFLLGYV